MGTLIMMSGCPGAGKSTWAKNYATKHPDTVVVSRDEIRFAVLEEGASYFSKENLVINTFFSTIIAKLRSGYNVIADASHLSWKARETLINEIQRAEKHIGQTFCEKYWVVQVDPGLLIAFDRNDQRSGIKMVPHTAITRMHERLTDPAHDPFHYDKIIYVRE